MRESWENLKTEPTSQKLLLSHLFEICSYFGLCDRNKRTGEKLNPTL